MFECEIEIVYPASKKAQFYKGLMPSLPEVGKTFFAYLEERPRYISTEVVISKTDYGFNKWIITTPDLVLSVKNKGKINGK
jgi:hypothetical protein